MVERMFGKRLKIVRNELKKSQIEMAEALNISVKGYWNYENGEREPKLEILKRLVEKFNINAYWLLTGKSENIFNNISNLFYDENVDKNKFLNIDKAYKNFGKRLTFIQDYNRYTDSKMAEILQINHTSYLDIKLCKKEPNIKLLNNLKKSFNVDMNWLLYGEDGYEFGKENKFNYPELTSNEIMILKKIANENDNV